MVVRRMDFLGLALLCLLCASCAKTTSQQAHELAQQNLYVPVDYANASVAGPRVLVLPGKMQTRCFEFLCSVDGKVISEFAELELSKAGFKVLDANSTKAILQEVEVAANLANTSKKPKLAVSQYPIPEWVLVFDVENVRTQTTEFRFVNKNEASLAGEFLGGKTMGALLSSINNSTEKREWNITLAYKVIDAKSGQLLFDGKKELSTEIKRELKGFIGIDSKDTSGVTSLSLLQKLIQHAVIELDTKKNPAPVAEAALKEKEAQAARSQVGATVASLRSGLENTQASQTPVAGQNQNVAGLKIKLPSGWNLKPVAVTQNDVLAADPGKQLQKGGSGIIGAAAAAQYAGKHSLSPGLMLVKMGLAGSSAKAFEVSGSGFEGMLLVLPNGGKLSPDAVAASMDKLFGDVVVADLIKKEQIDAASGPKAFRVYKIIKPVKTHEQIDTVNADGREIKDTKTTTLPSYYNMAITHCSVGPNVVSLYCYAPEEKFIEPYQSFKQLLASL